MNLYECIFVFGFLSVAIVCLTLLSLKETKAQKEIRKFRESLLENTRCIACNLGFISTTLEEILERRSSDEQQ